MKIGIITYHSAHNYGAMLQAYALQSTLAKLGHEVEFIHYHPKSVELKNLRRRKIQNIRQLVVRLAVILLGAKFRRRFANFDSFMNQHMQLTRRYESGDELVDNPPRFDAFICGSDQVWNMEQGGDPSFFLQFPVGCAKRIAYAPSFGCGTVPDKYKQKLMEWLGSFDAISVRESSGVGIISEVMAMDVPQVLDPVFLLSSTDWNEVAKEPSYRGKYILFYSLEVSPQLSALLRILSKRLKLPIVILGKGGSFVVGCKTKMAIDSGPAEFLGWFKHASFVVTNSFHATAFSIIYQKPFYTVPHSTRNARLESILKLTGLESRQIGSVEQVRALDAEKILNVDFSVVERGLISEIKKSSDFLRKALDVV